MMQDCYLQAELQNDIQCNWGGGEKEVNIFFTITHKLFADKVIRPGACKIA